MTTHAGLSAQNEEPNEDDLESALLERYWLGETSPEETSVLDAWFAQHPERAMWYARVYRGVMNDTWTDLSAEKVERMIGETLNAIAVPISAHTGREGVAGSRDASSVVSRAVSSVPTRSASAPLATTGNPRRTFSALSALRSHMIGISAAMILAIGLTWAAVHAYTTRGTSEYAYTTGVGQRITVVLADGSHVTLAPQTTVLVAQTFGVDARTVSVQGEAHFDVTSTVDLPFIVQSGAVQTRVLGTRFVVKAYPAERDIHVAVESGKVAVGHNNSAPAVLTAGNSVSVNDFGIVISDSTRLPEYTDWLHGQLTFERSPLPDVLATLSRWYGVQFRVADSSLMRSHVSGTMTYGSLEDMLKTLKDMLTISLTYERDATGSLTVTLRPAQVRFSAPPRYQREVNLPTGVGR